MPTTVTEKDRVVPRSNENIFLFIPNLIGKCKMVERRGSCQLILLFQVIRELFWRPCLYITCLGTLKCVLLYIVYLVYWMLLTVTPQDIIINVSPQRVQCEYILLTRLLLIGSKFGAVLDMVTDRYSVNVCVCTETNRELIVNLDVLQHVFYVSFHSSIHHGLFFFNSLFHLTLVLIICTCTGKLV